MAKRHLGLRIPLVVLCLLGHPAYGQAPDDAADAARLAEVLQLRDGSVVGDIGAGSGPLTVRIAPLVGSAGRVYSTDVNPQRLREITDRVQKSGAQNVTVVEGGSSVTRLPDSCCDALFMRDVYHHFAEPSDMNASLLRSLKPGGLLAVVDFPPRGGVTGPPAARDQGAAHGIQPEVLITELQAAGFFNVREETWSSPGYFLVVAERPR